jgi:DNA-binding SARP family transcriptional activator
MWIGLLGPMCVRTQEGLVRVPAAKQRALLAALAVRARNVATMESLAEAIWDANPPPSWEVTIRNYVRRLRIILGTASGGRIITSPPGYLLQAEDEEIDLLTFEALRKAGLAAARADRWQSADALLHDADALWRGTPFADIPSRPLRDAYTPFLEEARLDVLEARIDANLRLSSRQAADVIPELRRLATRHPERERFGTLLMLALYRSGRQAEALGVYRAARRFSVSEYGLEPGPELTAMHQRILTADQSLLTQPLNGTSALRAS